MQPYSRTPDALSLSRKSGKSCHQRHGQSRVRRIASREAPRRLSPPAEYQFPQVRLSGYGFSLSGSGSARHVCCKWRELLPVRMS
jgi:hypothetical protein